jgi:hypothetical protein
LWHIVEFIIFRKSAAKNTSRKLAQLENSIFRIPGISQGLVTTNFIQFMAWSCERDLALQVCARFVVKWKGPRALELAHPISKPANE